MAIITGNEYDHIDIVNGSNTNRHYLKDLVSREKLDLISESSVSDNAIDIFSKSWITNYVTLEIDRPDIIISGEGTKYSFARVEIDTTDFDRIYIKINKITGTGDKRLRYGKIVNGTLSWIAWGSSSSVSSYDTSVDVSDVDTFTIAFYLNYTGNDSSSKTQTTYSGITISNSPITDSIENSLTAVDNVSRKLLGYSEVPKYYLDNGYLGNKIQRINELLKAAAGNGDAFVFISDLHWSLNAKKSPALLKYIKNNTHIKQLFCGGDMGDSKSTNPNGWYNVGTIIRDTWGYDAHYVMGNHEYLGALNGEVETDDELYYAFRMYADNEVVGNAKRHYYYVNNDKQKIRYVFLNKYAESTDSGDHAGIGYERDQVNWLTNTALAVEAGWTIIIITHNIFNTVIDSNYSVTTSVPSGSQPIYDAIASYSGNGTIAAVICGHAHLDHITTIGSVPCLITTCDKNKDGGEATTYPQFNAIWEARSDGSINEQAFDVMVLDKTNRKVTAVRIGYPSTVENSDTPQEERFITY